MSIPAGSPVGGLRVGAGSGHAPAPGRDAPLRFEDALARASSFPEAHPPVQGTEGDVAE